MVYSAADLLKLQANIKRDPDGYRDEFLLQHRHYQACLQIFQLNPGQDAREFAEFISFIAQVSKVYPTSTAGFASELMALLESHGGQLEPQLRRAAVAGLILMRNRNQLDPLLLLPLLFKLFAVSDKALREMLFRHIIADLKAANSKARNERLNKGVQSFLYSQVTGEESELAAKKALAVLSELWRRGIWRDARTVNCIAAAVFHKSPRVMGRALKFFLGVDAAAAAGDDDDDEGSDDEGGGGSGKKGGASSTPVAAPSKEDVYKAMHKGTKSSKKKKQAKLKRVMASLKRASRREAAGTGVDGAFGPLHLLHDPHGFGERLLGRLQGSRDAWAVRLDMMTLLSRVVGVHKLLLLNLYPLLQKYAAPHTRDVTAVLAALVQAGHELVPPETLAPVLRQLVDQFVHDRARPEVMTVGLKAVRELCLRCPLIMTPELLQDLAEYKRFRDKEVASAARGLISAFREINPSLLAKKDRGRGAELSAAPATYGATHVAERLDGAALLEAALARGHDGSSSDDEAGSDGGSGSDAEESEEEEELEGSDEGAGGPGSSSEEGSEQQQAEDEDAAAGSSDDEGEQPAQHAAAAAAGSGSGDDEAASSGGESHSEPESDEGEEAGSSGQDDDEEQQQQQAAARSHGSGPPSSSGRGKQQPQQPGSLSSLKKQLAAAKAQKQAQAQVQQQAAGDGGGGGSPAQQQEQQEQQQQQQQEEGVPIEMTRILTEHDFKRIRELKRRALIKAALARHGLAPSASEAKKRRALVAAEAEAEEALALAGKRAKLAEATVAPDDLTGRHKRRADKSERLASVMAGREGREAFGARSKLKKKKSGGLSERQKQRQKSMPIAARLQQLKNRSTKSRQKSNPRHFKGHVRK